MLSVPKLLGEGLALPLSKARMSSFGVALIGSACDAAWTDGTVDWPLTSVKLSFGATGKSPLLSAHSSAAVISDMLPMELPRFGWSSAESGGGVGRTEADGSAVAHGVPCVEDDAWASKVFRRWETPTKASAASLMGES